MHDDITTTILAAALREGLVDSYTLMAWYSQGRDMAAIMDDVKGRLRTRKAERY